jgi:small GTP-binding protein
MRKAKKLKDPEMPLLKKKILMLGAFAVGKTSLVSRFVLSEFSEKYHSSMGIKVDKKLVKVGDNDVELMLWDLAGEDELNKVNTAYFRGASGYLLVIDGTRRDTFSTALMLRDRVEKDAGKIPYLVVINKIDLAGTDKWQLTAEDEQTLAAQKLTVFKTSAKTGQDVEETFMTMAKQLVTPAGSK